MTSTAQDVEPETQRAFDMAKERLPTAWREVVTDVRLARSRSLGVPPNAPLAHRLLDRAALAYFQNVPRRVVVTDAGVRGFATWSGRPPTEEEVRTLLIDGEVTQAKTLPLAWRLFVMRVWSWRDEPAPDPLPDYGAPEVWNRFLRDGVRSALGGEVPLEELLFHELAHAVQNQRSGMFRRIAAWGTWSDWRRVADDKPSDGSANGAYRNEDPTVLIRMLCGREDRGRAIYRPDVTSEFVNSYARFDMHEDFAECARLMAYAPQRLLRDAPTKFLYLNALGWSARMASSQPGPLWIEPTAAMRSAIGQAASRLLTAPHYDALAATAILRAHQHVLSSNDLPPADAPLQAPNDLPVELLRSLDSEQLTFVIDDKPRQLPRERLITFWDDALVQWHEMQGYAADLNRLLLTEVEDVRKRDASHVRNQSDPETRREQFDEMLTAARRLLPAAEWSAMLARERDFHRANERPLVAARYEFLRGNAITTPTGEPSFDLIELQTTIARQHLRNGDTAAALNVASAIQGMTWGAFRRAELIRAIHDSAPASRRLVEMIADCRSIPLPRWRTLVLKLLETDGR